MSEETSSITNILRNASAKPETSKRLLEAEEKVRELKSRIEVMKSKERVNDKSAGDWTETYHRINKINEIDDLEEQNQKYMKECLELKEYESNFLGHVHDHSAEKEIFNMKTTDKIDICEQCLMMGLYYIREGHYANSIEQFRLLVAYSEYIFPDNSSDLNKYKDLRYNAFMNISSLLMLDKQCREACKYAGFALSESDHKDQKVCSLVKISQIYREMHEYRISREKIEEANFLGLSDEVYLQQCGLIDRQRALSLRIEQNMAESVFNAKAHTPIKLSTNMTSSLLYSVDMPLEPLISESL